MPRLSRSETPSIDYVAQIRRMQEVVHLLENQPRFEVGDAVIANPLIYGEEYNPDLLKAGKCPVMVVCDTRPSWREVSISMGTPKEFAASFPESQAIFIAEVDVLNELQFRWVNAWNFRKAPEEMTKPRNGTSLNH